MVFVPHIRLSVNGDIGDPAAPVEIFSWGLSLSTPLVALPAGYPSGAQRTAVEGLLSAMHSSPALFISNQCRIRQFKWARIGPDGSYTEAPFVTPANIAGGSSGRPYPPQCSIGVTLESDDTYPSTKGRFYLPAPTTSLQISGDSFVIENSQMTDLMTVVGDTLQGINDALATTTPAYALVVASQGRTSPVRPPGNPVISGMRIGRAVDTQRRRRNNLVEDYRSRALTAL